MKVRELDSIDKRIIYELDRDSRQPNSKLAKKIRISPARLETKIESLEKDGVILDYISIIDYKKAGYTFYVCNLRLNNINSDEEDKILKKISMSSDATLVFACLGTWDVMLGTVAKDVFEAKTTFKKFWANFGDKIDKKMIVTHMGCYHYGRRYLLDGIKEADSYWFSINREKTGPFFITGGNCKLEKIDEKDQKLLGIISTNARMSTVKIARLMKSTPEKVSARMKMLKSRGIIRYYSILVNPEIVKTNYYRVYAWLKGTSHEEQLQMIEHMTQYEATYRIIETFEDNVFAIDIVTKDDIGLKTVLSSLKEKYDEKIERYEISNIFRIYKNSYYPTSQFRPKWKK